MSLTQFFAAFFNFNNLDYQWINGRCSWVPRTENNSMPDHNGSGKLMAVETEKLGLIFSMNLLLRSICSSYKSSTLAWDGSTEGATEESFTLVYLENYFISSKVTLSLRSIIYSTLDLYHSLPYNIWWYQEYGCWANSILNDASSLNINSFFFIFNVKSSPTFDSKLSWRDKD